MRVPFLSASLSPGSPRGFAARGFAACGLLLCLVFAGCSKQGQGERCDQNNGNLDCEGDLICKGEGQLSLQGQTRGVGLCCPPSSDEGTVEACRATQPLPPDVDAGPTETPAQPTPDAGAQPDAAAP